MTQISVLVCTRNRADRLKDTLNAVAKVNVPRDSKVELIVIDNASSDHTADVVRAFSAPNLSVRFVVEFQKGLARARNRGLKEAKGNLIVFTDDDINPPKRWLEELCLPLLLDQADAVTGAIRIPSSLVRPWMSEYHRGFVLDTRPVNPHGFPYLLGASMAFSREVLDKVPEFDPELGAGALGSQEDLLFSRQLVAAGFRITGVFDQPVVHNFDPGRLSKNALLRRASDEGRSQAYVEHHWMHGIVASPLWRAMALFVRLCLLRWKFRRQWPYADGAPAWELRAQTVIHFYLGYLQERHRPRNYLPHGLQRLTPSR